MKETTYLFKHGFFDENILALKIDGKEEFVFLVNENKFDGELNSIERVVKFLQTNYTDEVNNKKIEFSPIKNISFSDVKFQVSFVEKTWGFQI